MGEDVIPERKAADRGGFHRPVALFSARECCANTLVKGCSLR
jgi:hypothetical protein